MSGKWRYPAGASIAEGSSMTIVVGTQNESQRPEVHPLSKLDLVWRCSAPRQCYFRVLECLRSKQKPSWRQLCAALHRFLKALQTVCNHHRGEGFCKCSREHLPSGAPAVHMWARKKERRGEGKERGGARKGEIEGGSNTGRVQNFDQDVRWSSGQPGHINVRDKLPS